MNLQELQKSISVDKLKSCKNTLKKQFDYVYPLENHKSFFIGISDYVQIVEKSDYLSTLVKASILEERGKLIDEINRISEKSANESKATYKKLIATIKERKIDNPNVRAEIQEYNDYLDGKIHISGNGNFATHLCDFIRDIIISLKYNGYEDIADQYAIYGQTKEIITGWKISASEAEVDRILEKFKEKADVSLWGAWEELWWAYTTIQNKNEFWNSIAKSDNTFDRLNFGGLIGEMKEILEGKAPDPYDYQYFAISKFKRHLSRIHNHLENWLDDLILNFKDDSKANEEKESVDIKLVSNILSIGSNSITLVQSSFQHELCKIVLKDKESMSKVWDREEVLEEIYKYDIESDTLDLYQDNGKIKPDYRRKVYNSADRINLNILKQTGLKDFFIFSFKTIQVNPKYVS